jgi:hypothetical protein
MSLAYDSRIDTYKHIQVVQGFIGKVIRDMLRRSEAHDQSKLVPPEVGIFDEYTPKLAGTTYGSDEYRSYLTAMKSGLDHHYAANDHHPEYHALGGNGVDVDPAYLVNGQAIRNMSLVEIMEMLCDWKAASARHHDGCIRRSIEINQKRFGYSDELKQILLNTLRLIESP